MLYSNPHFTNFHTVITSHTLQRLVLITHVVSSILFSYKMYVLHKITIEGVVGGHKHTQHPQNPTQASSLRNPLMLSKAPWWPVATDAGLNLPYVLRTNLHTVLQVNQYTGIKLAPIIVI